MLIVGIEGTELAAHEREWLRQPIVSGVILFERNFRGREQVMRLIAAIRALRSAPFLICVDQEGGPVQRFRTGFSRLPALARLGACYERDPRLAVALAEEHAWLMASELRAIDVDLSFAPVLDLARGNRAIGERAFHRDPAVVSALGLSYLRGMRLAGMAATLKHFPGHGTVTEDTHRQAAYDPRSLEEIRETDLVPFADAITAGAEAVMMAHVTYPAVDPLPAGYACRWIEQVLRAECGFRGTVISDDVSMAAAEGAGGIAARIAAHRAAGCDLVLVCQPQAVAEVFRAPLEIPSSNPARTTALCGTLAPTWSSLRADPQRQRFRQRIASLEEAIR
jgi:beta-N-acetylhexosaminidase